MFGFGRLFSKADPELKEKKEKLIDQYELLQRNVQNLSREALLRSESILGRKRSLVDGEEASKRSRPSADEDRPAFEKHFEDLHRNLDDLEAKTAKTKEENYNLRSKVAELAERFKQKEDECKDFRETCTSAIQLMSGRQIEHFNFMEPQHFSVILRDGISKLMDEVIRSENDIELMNTNAKRKNLALSSSYSELYRTKEENVNLRGKVAELAERFKQKEEECNGFFERINKLVEELNGKKKEYVSLSRPETQLERYMTRLKTDITKVELMNSNLKRENLELRTALDKARAFSNSYSELNQSKETPKTDEEEHVLRVLSRLRDYEEQMKMLDISAMKRKLGDVTKSLAKTYGIQIRDLHMGILKLLEALKDDQINQQHEAFAHAIKSKTEALQKAQENCYLLSPDELRKKFRSDLAEDARAIEGELETFRQIIFDFPAVEAQRRTAYEDIVSALNRERKHLQDLSSSNYSSVRSENLVTFDLPADDVLLKNSYVKQTLERIVEINRSTEELEMKVNKFRGRRTSKIFLDLEHKLTNNIMSVDTIQVHGHEMIREKRREAVKYAHQCMDKLTNNVVNI